MKTALPTRYLLLQQLPGKPCQVLSMDAVYGPSVLFSGGRWKARDFLTQLRKAALWAEVPAYCEKKARRGHPPAPIQM
jgi:hypothetical protein